MLARLLLPLLALRASNHIIWTYYLTILSVEALRDAIAQNSHELAAARVDAELITRLNAAVANVTRLQNVGSELTKALSKAMDAVT
jgi:hypothetical protein